MSSVGKMCTPDFASSLRDCPKNDGYCSFLASSVGLRLFGAVDTYYSLVESVVKA